MLEEIFSGLMRRNAVAQPLADTCWRELVACYSAPERHYHTLGHLSDMLQQLQEVKAQVTDWDTLLFSLYYHDAVYDAQAKDNEARSAALAGTRMQAMGIPAACIEKCSRQILATKDHRSEADPDTDLLTDADLAILGREWPVYKVYSENVRQEYMIYPDALYKPGRKAVLQHFLGMERIFKTTYFYDRFEKQARQNLQQECDGL